MKLCPFEPFFTSKDDSDEAEPSSSKTPTKGIFRRETLFNRGIICHLFTKLARTSSRGFELFTSSPSLLVASLKNSILRRRSRNK